VIQFRVDWNEILFFSDQISFFRFVFVLRSMRLCWIYWNIADKSSLLARQFEHFQHIFIDFRYLINLIIWQDIVIVFDTIYCSISISFRHVFLRLSWLKMTLLRRRIVFCTISTKKHETHCVFETYWVIAVYKLVFEWIFRSRTIRNTYDQVSLTI
jgi:hypothetical protein